MSKVFTESVIGFLGPIKSFIEDPEVSEIMINGPHEIFVEKRGLIEKTDARFGGQDELMAAATNIAQFVKRPIGGEHSMLDARLPDGSRIHIIVPPVARNGITISIRKFSNVNLTLKHLIRSGSISVNGAKFIDICVYLKKNIMVSGGTGSGKSTLLGLIAGRIGSKQRIVVIEDSSELKISNDHVVYLETKLADNYGRGAVTIRDLVKSSLRLRPDRVIVGEVRGPEALDLVNAMNTGHAGSMGTIHSNSSEGALIRLETLSMIGDTNIPIQAIRSQVASAINVVIHTERIRDGSRKIVNVTEVQGLDINGKYICKDIFQYVQKGRKKDGSVIGEVVATGNMPSFMEEIQKNNIPVGKELFEIKKTS